MKAYRWNYGKKDYEETEILSGSTTLQFDMEKIVSCVSCGKEMRFGDGYMSKHGNPHEVWSWLLRMRKVHRKEWNEELKNLHD